MLPRCLHASVRAAALACFILLAAEAQESTGRGPAAVKRGEYVFRASGGCSCHTNPSDEGGAFLAGGRPLRTPFGTLYSTNTTPDSTTGIGAWSDGDFIDAMTRGVGPGGEHYFPAFPYTSFTGMTREDLLDLKAYLFSVPPVVRQNRPSELSPPFGWRPAVAVWKWMNFSPGAFQPDSTRSQQWNRGAYLATAVSHCGECHTPRGLSGGPKSDMYYAGTNSGPEGELAPNITPDEETGIGDWSVADISWYLQTGLKPDGDDTQGLMGEVIANGYGYLSEEDLEAIAVYLRSLEPIQNRVTPAPR